MAFLESLVFSNKCNRIQHDLTFDKPTYEPPQAKMCLPEYAIGKDSDQPACAFIQSDQRICCSHYRVRA